jgi:hypothetical protein
MSIPAYPLQWPIGWKRTESQRRQFGRFSSKGIGSRQPRTLSVYDAVVRVRDELRRLGANDDDLVVSTNVALRLDGFPRSDQREPSDPGVAVYWQTKSGATRSMAIDRYTSVAANLAAIAATLEALRAIERHGGAEIQDRAYTGFAGLPAPAAEDDFRAVLELKDGATLDAARSAYRRLLADHHPDRGGDAGKFNQVVRAWERAQRELV